MKKNKREHGQTLVIIAIMFLGLVAMAALIIDGGSLYLNRRVAQTAADAAAMAGAHELCVNKGSNSAIQTIVNQYALSPGFGNGATAVDPATIDQVNWTVSVRTTVETSSFFARVLGQENDTVRAEASAGCFAPSTTKDLLPITWTCQPPVGGSTEACEVDSIPWNVFQTLLTTFNFGPGKLESMLLTKSGGANGTYTDTIGGKMAYIVMDDDKFDPSTICMTYIGDPKPLINGTVKCDFDNDGTLEVEGGANRGWLYLGGQQGAKGLKHIMQYGYPDPISVPQWFPGENGAIAATLKEAQDYRINKIALVPVFNAVCEGMPDTTVGCEWVPGDLIGESNGKPTYYRVAGFAPFVVTCVSGGNAPSQRCPAKAFANVDSNAKTIEGYFVSGYAGGTDIDLDGFDLGTYIISLSK